MACARTALPIPFFLNFISSLFLHSAFFCFDVSPFVYIFLSPSFTKERNKKESKDINMYRETDIMHRSVFFSRKKWEEIKLSS
jgi:hypothetical protein